MTWEQWVSVVALVIALLAAVLGLLAWRNSRRRHPLLAELPEDDSPAEAPPGPAAVIFNPSKTADGERLRELVRQVCAEIGLGEPLWFETTVEDPGRGQTHEALHRGASVVIAAGGDGTVRAVASVMAGTGVPMGLLPVGTGNLLARNLDLPLGDDRETVAVALTGRTRAIDIGWLRIESSEAVSETGTAATAADVPLDGKDLTGTPPAPETTGAASPAATASHPDGTTSLRHNEAAATDEHDADHLAFEEHAFLVIAGLGFDASMVRDTDDELKARIGWIAYFVAGVRHLTGPKIDVSLELGDGTRTSTFAARTILLANCGRLPGGVVLLPDASIDDGWLDVAAIDTRGGLIGWLDLLRRVVLHSIGIRRVLSLYEAASIDTRRSRSATIRVARPTEVQVDGDLLGTAHAVHSRLDPGGLLVRTS